MKFSLSHVLMTVITSAAALHLALAHADDGGRQLQFARGLYARAQWAAASQEFESLLKQHPDHPERAQITFYLGEALVQQRRYGDAEKCFQDYLNLDPDGPYRKQALFRIAECAFLGNAPSAQEKLKSFSDTFPNDRLNALILAYRGQTLLKEQKAKEAESLFRNSLERFPEEASRDASRLGLARSLEKLGRTEEAERYYLALASKPQSPAATEAKYRLASLQYAQQRYTPALESFAELDSIPASNPWAANARLGKGWTLMKLGRHGEAAKGFEELTGNASVAVQAWYWLGLCRKAEKDWTGATEALLAGEAKLAEEQEKVVKPGSAGNVTTTALLFHAGDAQLAAGDLAAARRHLDRAIKFAAPDDDWLEDAHRASVQTSIRLKDYSVARKDAERFLGERPGSPVSADLLRLLARIQMEQDDFDAAGDTLARLQKASGSTKGSVEDAYLLALCHQGQGRNEAALEALQPVLSQATGKLAADAHLVEASLLVALKRYEDALKVLRVLQGDPKAGEERSQTLALMAICNAHLGHGDESLRLYEEAFVGGRETGTLRWDTAEQIAETALNAKQYDRAESLYRKLIEGDVEEPRKQRALVGLAWVQHNRSDNEAAEATLAKVLGGGLKSDVAVEALYLRGRVYRELGQLEAACQAFEQLLSEAPKSEYVREAMWELGQLNEKLGHSDRAAAAYDKIRNLVPPHSRLPDALYSLAWIRQDEGKVEAAASEFREVFAKHRTSPYWAHAALALSQLEFDAGRGAEAEAILEELLANEHVEPIRDRALYLAGQIAFSTGHWQQSRKTFERLVKECPGSDLAETAAFAAAEAAFHAKDSDSIALFESISAGSKNLASAFRATVPMRLAQLYAEAERWDDAMTIVDTFAENHPDFAQQFEMDYVRGRCLAARAMFAEARQAYEKVIRSSNGENTETAAKAQLMIAETYFHQRRYEEAYRAYMQVEVLYAYPELQSAAMLQAAKCQELLGHSQVAAGLYRQLVENYAETTAAQKAAVRLNHED